MSPPLSLAFHTLVIQGRGTQVWSAITREASKIEIGSNRCRCSQLKTDIHSTFHSLKADLIIPKSNHTLALEALESHLLHVAHAEEPWCQNLSRSKPVTPIEQAG